MMKKLKGFTLVELIIVMAIFGVIMAAALGLMTPVSNIFSSTVKYEQTRSAVDNITRYMNGTLRYADRFSMYIQYDNGTIQNEITESNITENVIQFAGEHFCGEHSSSLTDPEGTPINVLVFDNDNYKIYQYTVTPGTGKNWRDVITYNSDSKTYSSTSVSLGTATSPINDGLLQDYSFKVLLGRYEYNSDGVLDLQNYESNDTSASDYITNYFPKFSNMPFTIVSYKNLKDSSGNITSREELQQSTSLSFGLVNVIDVNGSSELLKEESLRYYVADPADGKTNFPYDTVTRANIYPNDDDRKLVDRMEDSFYIIYTLPERAEDYQANNQNAETYAVVTTTTATSTT